MRFTLAALVVLASTVGVQAEGLPRFEGQVLDPDIGKVCYAVSKADVNGDGKPDIVAVSENRVQWYENPSWTKHVILEDATERDNVCIAAHDIDGDGKVDFALGAGWTKIGTIQWISRNVDPNAKWNVHFIGKETSLHRMTFADVLGEGKPQLVISPLLKSVAPGVRFSALSIPANPRSDRWPQTVLDESLNRMHGHTHGDVDGNTANGLESIVAAEEGVFLVSRKAGGEFAKTRLGEGATGSTPETRGAGEVKAGRWAMGVKPLGVGFAPRFLATVEPMHGNAVVAWFPPASGSVTEAPWRRVLIDDTLRQAHAVWTVDLTGDGSDEIVAGHREPGTGAVKGPGLYVYESASDDGSKWTKHVIDDGGCAVEDAFAADLDGDGRPDLVAGGRATHNVKVYWNRAK
jgi:hypothetical protein